MHKTGTYGKHQKLKSKKEIDQLFKQGRSIFMFPIKLLYDELDTSRDEHVRASVGVSSRYFKKSVDRNRIKRLLRECWRQEKEDLEIWASSKGVYVNIFLVYVDKTVPEHSQLSIKFPALVEKLIYQLNEHIEKDY
jgi:ribonuclease P protein component